MQIQNDTTAPRPLPVQAAYGGALAVWQWVVLAAVVVAVYHDIFWRLIQQWWNQPDFSHGFLVPILCGYVAWERREHLRQVPASPSWTGLLVLLFSLVVLFLGVFGAELFLSRVSFLGVLVGLLLFLHGWPLVRALVFPLAALLLMIPLPALIYNQIVFPLQLLASHLAAFCLQYFHLVPVLREGNVLVLPGTRLEVAEACSGIRSLTSMLTLAVFYGYFAERRTWIRITLALAVVPIAIFSNAVRVIFAAISAERWGEAAVEGTVHLISGVILFVVATLTLAAFHLLLRGLAQWREARR